MAVSSYTQLGEENSSLDEGVGFYKANICHFFPNPLWPLLLLPLLRGVVQDGRALVIMNIILHVLQRFSELFANIALPLLRLPGASHVHT